MSVKSAVRVVRIFELLSNHPDGLTVKEISKELSLPQSSTFNLAATLLDEGYLQQDAIKRYRLGAKLIQVGTAAMESIDISSQGVPFLKQLMDGVQETVFMAVLSDDQLVYIAKIDNNRSIRTTAQPGSRKPLYCTGLGKAFLAFMPEDKREGLLDRMEFIRFTGHTITARDELEKQLQTFWNRDMPLTMKKMKKVCLSGGACLWSGWRNEGGDQHCRAKGAHARKKGTYR